MSGPHGYKLASELVDTLLTSVKEDINRALGQYTRHHDDPVNFHQKDKAMWEVHLLEKPTPFPLKGLRQSL